MENKSILEVNNLSVKFSVDGNNIKIVDDINFDIKEGEVLALLGESGCGKSVLASAILKILPENSIVEGKVLFKGKEMLHIKEKEFRKYRGKQICVIPQSAASSLNPLFKVGNQIRESLQVVGEKDKTKSFTKIIDMLKQLELPRPEKVYKSYPHELSGGMTQRTLVAMGSISKPEFIVVDEPTKGLDVDSKKQVVRLLKQMEEQNQCSILLITHDLEVAEILATIIAVMYAGEIIEIGTTQKILNNPKHPYTIGLLNSLPQKGFKAIKGFSPSMTELPTGCYFSPRCPIATERCFKEHPKLDEKFLVRCHNVTRGK